MSGAPLRVHLVNIAALFIALVIPNLIVIIKNIKKPLYVWFFGGVIGLLLWDIFSTYVIAKKEIFMGWHIIYPIGIFGLLSLQTFIKYISGKLPYNKSFKTDAAKSRGAL